MLRLSEAAYRDKVEGAWRGKSIGATLGSALRGSLIPGRLTFVSTPPGQPVSSLGIDFSLLWLSALEEYGVQVTSEDLALEVLEHLDVPNDELGYALLNVKRGLPPPASGAHSNPFRHGSLAAQRADFWGVVSPGSPQTAAALAYRDATVDHCEDGEWAAMFLAAVASASFFLTDPLVLTTIGLAMIPKTCRTARGIKTGLAAAQRGASWLEARESVLNEVGSKDYSDVAQNMGFFTIGLFYGLNDFAAVLLAGVNCGYNSEMVGGALGTIYGIQRGSLGLPGDWKAAVGDMLLPGSGLRDLDLPFPVPISLVIDRTVAAGLKNIEANIPELTIGEAPEVVVAPEPPVAESSIEVTEMPVQEPVETSGFEASSAVATSSEPVEEQAQQDTPVSQADSSESPALEAAPEESAEDKAARAIAALSLETRPAYGDDETPTVMSVPKLPEFAPPAASTDEVKLAEEKAEDQQLDLADQIANALAPSTPSVDAGTLDPASFFAPQAVAQPSAAADAPPSAAMTPQPVVEGGNEPVALSAIGHLPAPSLPMATLSSPLEPDPLSAIAWTDNTLVKPLLVTPVYAQTISEGDFAVVMDTGEHPTIGYGELKRLVVTVINRSSEPFVGKMALLAPGGWQVSPVSDPNQRQFLAGNGGAWRGEYLVRAPEATARIEISNSLAFRLIPESGAPVDAGFVLMGASCWWTTGPFANFDGDGFDRSFTPENAPGLHETYVNRLGMPAKWERRSFPEAMLDLEPLFSFSAGTLYGQTIINTPSSRSARIVANVNSGVKVWLNGTMVLRRFQREAFRPQIGGGNWAADVELRAGPNLLLVKWVRTSEPIQFSLTISDRDGRGLPETGNTHWS